MLHFAEATKGYLVHRGLTTHDVEKHPATKRYARVSFSPAKSGISSGRYSSSSPTRVGLVDPPRTRRQSRKRKEPFDGGLPQLARLVGSFFSIETIDRRVLQNVEILAALGLAVARPDLVEQIAHL